MTDKVEVHMFPNPPPKCRHGVPMRKVKRMWSTTWETDDAACVPCAEEQEAREENDERWVDGFCERAKARRDD